MAVISFNQNAKGEHESITIKGNEKEIEKIIDYVRHMYDKHVDNNDDNNGCMGEADMVNHPSHYANHGMECIDEMILLYGKEETMSFCKLNAHKYRKRALYKGGEEDLKKSDWYIRMYVYLEENSEKTLRLNILKKNGMM